MEFFYICTTCTICTFKKAFLPSVSSHFVFGDVGTLLMAGFTFSVVFIYNLLSSHTAELHDVLHDDACIVILSTCIR